MLKALTAAFVIALLGACAFAAAPFHTVSQIRKAAQASDPAALAKFVDFPVLRKNVKKQLEYRLGDESKTHPFLQQLRSAVARGVLSPMVDFIVDPKGVAALVNGQTPFVLCAKNNACNVNDPVGKSRAEPLDFSMSYAGLNSFELKIGPKGSPDWERVVLVLERANLFDWKLANVRLPSMN